MTSGEKKALLFLAGITVLGSAARLVSAPSRAPSRAERDALAGQLAAVDSARVAPRTSGRARAPRATGPASRRRRAVAADTTPRTEREVGPVAPPAPPAPVDVDVADSAALEGLPGIGPALARRIVEDRREHGPFGSSKGLERVRGVGPKLVERLAPRVTFGGVARPP